jgi:hypothetical protein
MQAPVFWLAFLLAVQGSGSADKCGKQARYSGIRRAGVNENKREPIRKQHQIKEEGIGRLRGNKEEPVPGNHVEIKPDFS